MSEAKLEITDELLVAYVDDELHGEQRALVSSIIASDPAVSRRADDMRLSRHLLREAFPLSPDSPVPAPIEAASNRLAAAYAARSAQPRRVPLFRFPWRFAFSAGLALCVVAAASYLGWQAARSSADRPITAMMRIDPDTTLHDVLESTPSAALVNVPAQDATVRAILTFRAKDGRFCREFEVLTSHRGSTGIACRENGAWRAEVLLNAADAPRDGDHYAPAGSADDAALARVAERLMADDPFSAQQEARLLAGRWQLSHSP